LQRIEEDEFFFAEFSKIKVDINDQIVEGAKVATRITMEVTHTGFFHGIKESGRRVTIPFIDFAIIQQGKIIEEWNEFDLQSIIS